MEAESSQDRSETQRAKKCGIPQSSCVYTSCFCEENVWKLCERIRNEQLSDLSEYSAVFISNNIRQIPLWMQRHGMDPLSPIMWDYHVILVQKCSDNHSYVYDLDCIIPFPCSFETYIEQVIRSDRSLKKQYHRKFRVIPAEVFLATFASDRSHMKKSNGEWIKTPPPYPPIRTDDEEMNLDDFIDMTPAYGEGEVKDLKSFVAMFKSH